MINQLRDLLDSARRSYFQLILISGTEEPQLLEFLKNLELKYTILEVGMKVAGKMLDLTKRQRSLQLSRVLDELVCNDDADVIMLENIEVLFDPDLKHDPLRLLQDLSRNRLVLAIWPGEVKNGKITYADPGHREHKCYEIHDFNVFIANDE